MVMLVLISHSVNNRSSREMNEVRVQRQSRQGTPTNLIEGMTKKERAEYVKNALQTKVRFAAFPPVFHLPM